VIVEIEDDGGGVALDRVRQKAVALGLITAEEAERLTERETVDLVFRPGFSTAASVTQISGRGVGMDVVRTNVERIGGSVEMVSRTGHGSTCRIRVPLTLVIVPALVVESSGQMFAIPQASLAELVRITPEREARMIADLGGTPVLRLRGEVLPLVDLAALMQTGEARRAVDGGRSVVVLRSQGRTFGLLVDDVADTEEIVVKPLARQLQQLGVYSGATVRGDGRVALVLDVNGLARRASVLEDGDRGVQAAAAVETSAAARRTYLVLRGADDGRLAIPLGEVRRLEEIDPSHIEPLGAGEAVQYRGAILPLVRLSDALPERRQRPRVAPPPQAAGEKVPIVVQCLEGRDVGLVVDTVLDVVDEAVTLDVSRARAGVAGCAVIQGRITEVLDTSALLAAHLARPEAAHG
jgi:two-component system chemotaxis sensor kinase CheA